jgi:lysophospholipase L1-like esterase
MTHSDSPHPDLFPLAGKSRARRRLALAQYQPIAGEAVEPEEVEANREFAVRGVQQALADTAAGFDSVHRLLSAAEVLTWIVAGDRLVDDREHARTWRCYSEYFSDLLRSELNRDNDLIVDLTTPGETAGELRRRLEAALLQVDADVILVTLGFCDAREGARGRAIFLHNLKQVVELIRSEQAVPILQTPHLVDAMQSEFRAAMRPYINSIRETARELDAGCVDHWAAWQREESQHGSLKNWLDPEGMYPNSRGHSELARLLGLRLGRTGQAGATGQVSPE